MRHSWRRQTILEVHEGLSKGTRGKFSPFFKSLFQRIVFSSCQLAIEHNL